MSNREVEISGEVRRETTKAYLWWDGKVEAWVPKSQISDLTEERDGSISSIFIPEWLALEKGFL